MISTFRIRVCLAPLPESELPEVATIEFLYRLTTAEVAEFPEKSVELEDFILSRIRCAYESNVAILIAVSFCFGPKRTRWVIFPVTLEVITRKGSVALAKKIKGEACSLLQHEHPTVIMSSNVIDMKEAAADGYATISVNTFN